ncbi:uncharacterized protein LOC8029187 [Ixodes scapularis]|uniref:uncharacterized protein LOC8029187 n=1 Tax=Ixodes scapularis TaxID=6945 RepID=UPI001A9D3F85|nr:uncharacterized protein LOC8029187 [Ixodes scapularis]
MGSLQGFVCTSPPLGLVLLCTSAWVNALVKSNGSEPQQQFVQQQPSATSLSSGSLVVSVSRVSDNYAEIAWRREPASSWQSSTSDDPTSTLSGCDLAYGPLEDPYQVEVMSNFMPRGPTFTVGGLRHNATYHFHMVCYCCLDGGVGGNGTTPESAGTKLASNVLKFTTATRSGSPGGGSGASGQSSGGGGQSSWQQQDPYKGSYHSVYKQTILRDEDSSRAVPSFNVLLGALTGIVGFLIINVTVVIAVRRCSHRRMRRRRILVLEERDNEDFPYLRAID